MVTNFARPFRIGNLYFGLLLSCAAPYLAIGAEKPLPTCSTDDAMQAEDATDLLNTWDDVYRFYKKYRHCYDGGIAEGVHDKVQLLWANHWDQLPLMLAMLTRDSGFKRFIWPIIKVEDFPMDEFERILTSAQHNCPRDAAEFCAAIKQQSRRRYPRHGA